MYSFYLKIKNKHYCLFTTKSYKHGFMGNTNNITTADRLRGMIWGQLVGDAAALGSHWIYNLSELKVAYPNGIHGFEIPKEGH